MDLRARLVYHQVHPLKLFTDPLSGLLATILLWRGQRLSGWGVAIAPPAAASVLLVSRADLRSQRRSFLGRYAQHTPLWTFLPRLTGYGVLLLGASRRQPAVAVAGFLLVGLGLLPWGRLRR